MTLSTGESAETEARMGLAPVLWGGAVIIGLFFVAFGGWAGNHDGIAPFQIRNRRLQWLIGFAVEGFRSVEGFEREGELHPSVRGECGLERLLHVLRLIIVECLP